MYTKALFLLVVNNAFASTLQSLSYRPHEYELRPSAGSSWGSWGDSEFCPENSWAAGFQLMNEPSCGDACDDTSLNGVKLFCVSKTSPGVVEVTSKKGGFGGWMGVHMCDGVDSFITGIQFKSERETKVASKHLDETAGNNINMACSHGPIMPGDGNDFGDWSNFEICPENTAVCGLRTMVEEPQGIFTDDTSLNQIILYCCDYF